MLVTDRSILITQTTVGIMVFRRTISSTPRSDRSFASPTHVTIIRSWSKTTTTKKKNNYGAEAAALRGCTRVMIVTASSNGRTFVPANRYRDRKCSVEAITTCRRAMNYRERSSAAMVICSCIYFLFLLYVVRLRGPLSAVVVGENLIVNYLLHNFSSRFIDDHDVVLYM